MFKSCYLGFALIKVDFPKGLVDLSVLLVGLYPNFHPLKVRRSKISKLVMEGGGEGIYIKSHFFLPYCLPNTYEIRKYGQNIT